MSEEIKQGWGWPGSSKKAHYFQDKRSLCLKWMYSGDLEQGNDQSSDNCKDCMRRLTALRKVKS